MTRKDYVLLAKALRAALADVCNQAPIALGVECARDRIADALAQDSPAFDRARFLAACGLE